MNYLIYTVVNDIINENIQILYTEGEIKVCTWLREISSCSCLNVLPGPAWVLLSKTYKPLFTPLYMQDP